MYEFELELVKTYKGNDATFANPQHHVTLTAETLEEAKQKALAVVGDIPPNQNNRTVGGSRLPDIVWAVRAKQIREVAGAALKTAEGPLVDAKVVKDALYDYAQVIENPVIEMTWPHHLIAKDLRAMADGFGPR